MRRALVVVAILVIGLDAQSPAPAGAPGPTQPGVRTPPRDGRGVQTGTAAIRGSVVDVETGQPIRRATVIFRRGCVS